MSLATFIFLLILFAFATFALYFSLSITDEKIYTIANGEALIATVSRSAISSLMDPSTTLKFETGNGKKRTKTLKGYFIYLVLLRKNKILVYFLEEKDESFLVMDNSWVLNEDRTIFLIIGLFWQFIFGFVTLAILQLLSNPINILYALIWTVFCLFLVSMINRKKLNALYKRLDQSNFIEENKKEVN